jgi:hypothetical protein
VLEIIDISFVVCCVANRICDLVGNVFTPICTLAQSDDSVVELIRKHVSLMSLILTY